MARQDNTFVVSFLTSLVVSVGTSLVMYLLVLPRIGTPGMASRPTELSVPALIGAQMGKARTVLSEMGLRMNLAGQIHHPTQSLGVILSQIPAAGSRIRSGGEVKVVISLGPATASATPVPPEPAKTVQTQPTPRRRRHVSSSGLIKIPRVTNTRYTWARSTLEGLGLHVSVSFASDEDVAPNMVISQSPGPGTRVQRGTTVHLRVNKE